MAKFITKSEQIKLFQQIVKASIKYGDSNPALLGKIVNEALTKANVKQSWINYSNNLSSGEKEILEALEKKFAIRRLDGLYYYEEDNISTTGPFALIRDSRCHVLSSTSINKLLEKRIITVLCGHIHNDNCVQIVSGG